jgi:DDE family transposase
VCVPATETGERDAATGLIAGLPPRRVTIGGDKGYDTRSFVGALRALEATPHIAQKKRTRTLDARTTRRAGCPISQRVQKRIEEVFGWMKTVAAACASSATGAWPGELAVLLAAAAYNPVRMRTLEATT